MMPFLFKVDDCRAAIANQMNRDRQFCSTLGSIRAPFWWQNNRPYNKTESKGPGR